MTLHDPFSRRRVSSPQRGLSGLPEPGPRRGPAPGGAAAALMIGLCLTFGTVGWIGLGAFFAVLGLTAPAIARCGERTRPAVKVAHPSRLEGIAVD